MRSSARWLSNLISNHSLTALDERLKTLTLDSAYSDKHESVPCKGFDSVRSKESKLRTRVRWVPLLFRDIR